VKAGDRTCAYNGTELVANSFKQVCCRSTSAKHFRKRKKFARGRTLKSKASHRLISCAFVMQATQHTDVTDALRITDSTEFSSAGLLAGDVLSKPVVDAM
jgi:hypothetical protein